MQLCGLNLCQERNIQVIQSNGIYIWTGETSETSDQIVNHRYTKTQISIH